MKDSSTTTTKRKPIGKKLRFDVFKRDGFSCQYCGAVPPSVLLQVDHIVPVKLGGENDVDNLVTACQPCNIGKGANSLSCIPKSMEDKASETQEREAQIIAYNKIIMKSRDRIDKDCWKVINYYLESIGEPLGSIPISQFNSIKMFVTKVGLSECLDGMDISITRWATFNKNKVFKYFCGVMWRKVKESDNEH